MAKRVAIAERGVALLALIAAAPNGTLNLTQDEAGEIVSNGLATVAGDADKDGAAPVTLTDAGRAALAAPAPAALAVSGFTIDDGIPMPGASARGGRQSSYPFEALNVGQSFHVPATAENPTPADRLASSVSGARARFSVEVPGQFETVEVKEYVKDASGKYVKDAEGKRVVASSKTETRPKRQLTRDFVCKSVDASDPKGPGARVWRTK